MARIQAFTTGVLVRSPVGWLRSHKPHGMAKKKKKKKEQTGVARGGSLEKMDLKLA